MSIQQKILQGYGYTMPDQVELLWTGTEYRIDKWPTNNPPTIAEIEAIVLPELPDWRSFRSALVMSSAYGRITGHNNQTLAILPVLVNVAFLLDSDASRAVEFAGLWNAIASIAEPTTQEIAVLNAIASADNVPFQLNAQGLIT
jgi:hypothetical protein